MRYFGSRFFGSRFFSAWLGGVAGPDQGGNTIRWTVNFTDRGEAVVPDAASVFVNYRSSASDDTERETAEVAMQESGGIFIGDWSSDNAVPGRVFWSVRASDPDIAQDGVIRLK